MLNQLNIGELTAKLAQREVSAREITAACLNQISRQDEKIHAFLSYDSKDALAQADAADEIISRQGVDGSQPLLGIPVAIKDVLAEYGRICHG
jgi:aspartyl-tRNA(Asn)/glutamyl-tRNA(Gln) amidotransferase subunit A